MFFSVKQILLALLPYLALLKIIWDMPNVYPFNEEKIDVDGMVRHLIEVLFKYLIQHENSHHSRTLICLSSLPQK